MKQIDYKAIIIERGTKRKWVEVISDLVVDDMTNLRHAKFLIRRFNNSLEKGEKPRRVMRTLNSEFKPPISHNWGKVSFSIEKGGYYRYKCANCPATGKRHGTIAYVTPDRNYTIYCKGK